MHEEERDRWAEALAAWRALLGESRVLAADKATARYGADCTGLSRTIAGALRVTDAAEVAPVVRIARAHGVALHPLSTGRNWGYGSALPPAGPAVLLDLGGLNRILAFDEDFGVVTLEPGVTQGQLDRYLRGLEDGRARPFMVPTTGAGPDCSLVGNALERGYGITPHADHFGAVTDIEAVLPDGSTYRTALHELAGPDLARLHKWGIGAYTAGMFSQSGFGIVTRMSIVLARRPAATRVMLFSLKHDALLEPAVEAVRSLLAELPSTLGGINLMNRHRIMAMTAPYPFEQVAPGGTMPTAVVDRIGREFQILPWTGFGTLYGNTALLAAAQRTIRRSLSGIASRLLFVSPALADRLVSLAGWLPGALGTRAGKMASTLQQAVAIAQGMPSHAALPLAYWRLRSGQHPGAEPHPARDGSGLIWYAPLVPMRPAQVRQVIDGIRALAPQHGVEPLVTLTSLNERLFDCTIPILFDPAEAGARDRAIACLRALQQFGLEAGVFPYRVDIDTMAWLRQRAPDATALVTALSASVGGAGIISPGRYFGSTTDQQSPARPTPP